MIITEDFVKKSVIKWLSRKGYDRKREVKANTEHGVDIKVMHSKYPRYFLIEAKGDPDSKKVKYPASVREVSFVYGFGQIVSRMGYKANYRYGLALPISFEDKIRKRLNKNLLRKLNHLVILLVDSSGKVKEINWKNIGKLI